MSTPSSPGGGWDHPDQGRPETGPAGWPAPQGRPAAGPPPGPQADAWWQTPPPSSPAGPWAEPVPAPPRRRGRGPRALGVGAAVLALSLLGGYVGAVLHDRLDESASSYPGVSIPAPSEGTTVRPAGSVAGIAAAALPSVVALQVVGADGAGTGSGFVLDTTAGDAAGGAFVLTNNHVVAGATDDGITVLFQDGQQSAGTVVGADASYDLAVVRVDRADLPALPLGDSGSVVVGDPVVAVGAPLGLQGTVTEGIVSALNRPVTAGESADSASYIQAIQTDAAINPGNSGGPLLNSAGEVIGVNSAIAALPGSFETGGSIGLGFSIPSDQARRTAEQLIQTGRAVHPVIRVTLDNSYSGEGVQIAQDAAAVTPGGPGDRAGLRPGDVVLAIDGRPVTDPSELIVDIRAREPGDTVTLTLSRGGETVQVPVTLDAEG